MRINEETMLFEDISSAEREAMLAWVKTVVLKNKQPTPDPAWVIQWMEKFDYYGAKRNVNVMTTFPQHVMLSLLMDTK